MMEIFTAFLRNSMFFLVFRLSSFQAQQRRPSLVESIRWDHARLLIRTSIWMICLTGLQPGLRVLNPQTRLELVSSALSSDRSIAALSNRRYMLCCRPIVILELDRRFDRRFNVSFSGFFDRKSLSGRSTNTSTFCACSQCCGFLCDHSSPTLDFMVATKQALVWPIRYEHQTDFATQAPSLDDDNSDNAEDGR